MGIFSKNENPFTIIAGKVFLSTTKNHFIKQLMNTLSSFLCHPQMIKHFQIIFKRPVVFMLMFILISAFTNWATHGGCFSSVMSRFRRRVHLEIIIFSSPAFQLYLCEGEHRLCRRLRKDIAQQLKPTKRKSAHIARTFVKHLSILSSSQRLARLPDNGEM